MQGLIIREYKNNECENKKWKLSKKFNKLTYWNRESRTTDADLPQKWLRWLELSTKVRNHTQHFNLSIQKDLDSCANYKKSN